MMYNTGLMKGCVKTSPNYPLHPPMPASRHPGQVLHIPADCQLPERSGTSEN